MFINIVVLSLKMAIETLTNYIENIPLTILIPYTIGFLVLLIGSYTDIKTREVPDWVNFGLISMGFGINLLFSAIYWKIDFIVASVAGFAVFFIITSIMFYAGQWGGGDSKILMGLGAMIGIDFFSGNFFLAWFLINALIVGALYGILWSIVSIINNKEKFLKSFKKDLSNKKVMVIRRVILALFVILALAAILVPDNIVRLILLYLAFVSVITFYIWIAVKSVENACMLRYVEPQKLTEGDWIAKEVKINGEYITGPKDLGVSKKQIRKLVGLYKMGKVRKILVKEGIPFVPSFFVAYIFTLIFGNLLFFLV